ncbi:hypothetical protein A4R35_22520 [Thermogemmatispora tikiterensis]|uniref:Uncharacterized protein n=1 Tax=Thermogemmatispora tikiterensis TaxID=1825093 RepID=A0A328VQ65_9CHLR|nr:hypothetical protein A4R35_22520 [Thermogemmatispora tikiterensis]
MRWLLFRFLFLARRQVARHSSMLDHEAVWIGTEIDQVHLLAEACQQLSALLFCLSARRSVDGFQMVILAIAKRVFHYPEDFLRR